MMLLTVILMSLTVVNVDAADTGCRKVKYTLMNKGISGNEVPLTPQKGVSLSLCSTPAGEGSCCTKEIEDKLLSWSSQQYKLAIEKRATQISNSIKSKSSRVEEFVKGLMTDSQNQFDENFRRTYGILYEKNAVVFTDYFQELKNFFLYGDINLVEITDKFFTTLYQKMFQVMNSQYNFDETFLTCFTKHMSELRPFGDVPQKMSSSVKRSMVAMRALMKALKSGIAIAENVKKLESSTQCLEAVQKMNSCPACHGYSEIKPCNNYCLNVMKGCLAYHIEVQQQWDKFIESLISLTERLTGPFNVEQVVMQLDISISDAIMNFQDSGFKVTQKAFESCGTPRLVTKREAVSNVGHTTNEFSALNQTLKRNLKRHKTELERLMNDLKKGLKPSQGYWSKMPFAMCSNTASSDLDLTLFFENSDDDLSLNIANAPLENDRCWNGKESGSYHIPVVEDGLTNQFHNPEVPLDTSNYNQDVFDFPNTVKEQIFLLKSITNQLRTAHMGHDVEWWDRELERRDQSAMEGSGLQVYYGYEDDEDFAHGSGDFQPVDEENFYASGDLETTEYEPKVTEPWRPWSPEEIEVIETSSDTPVPPPTVKPHPTSGTSDIRPTLSFSLTLTFLGLSLIYLSSHLSVFI